MYFLEPLLCTFYLTNTIHLTYAKMLSKSRLNSGFQRAKALHFSFIRSVFSHTFRCSLPMGFFGALF